MLELPIAIREHLGMFPLSQGGTAHANVKLTDAAQILDILAESAREDLDRTEKVAWMLRRIGPLIGEGLDFHILLLDQLHRQPFPRLLDRVTCGSTFDLIEPRDNREVQRLLDLCEPMAEIAVIDAIRRLRVPTTYIYSSDTSRPWFNNVFKPFLLDPNFWQDCMASYWSPTRDRLIIVNAFLHRGSNPFTAKQEQLLSLATRAIAPVMDADLFAGDAASTNDDPTAQLQQDLPAELRPLLLVVLQGESPAQIARFTGMMVDEVDIAIRRLCEYFGVSNRAELVASFVDQRVVNWLEKDAFE